MKTIKTPYITNLRKVLVSLALLVIVQGTALAQDDFGADDTGPGDFGGGDNPLDEPIGPSPIDDYLGALVLLGIGFAFYKSKVITRKIN